MVAAAVVIAMAVMILFLAGLLASAPRESLDEQAKAIRENNAERRERKRIRAMRRERRWRMIRSLMHRPRRRRYRT